MKYQILLSVANKIDISKCRLLQFLPRMLVLRTEFFFFLGLREIS